MFEDLEQRLPSDLDRRPSAGACLLERPCQRAPRFLSAKKPHASFKLLYGERTVGLRLPDVAAALVV